MLFFPIFLNNVPIKTEAFVLIGRYSRLVCYRLFGTAYRPHPRASSRPKAFLFSGGSVDTHTSARVQLTVHGRYKATETAHLILLLNVCYFLFYFYICIYVVFVYFCLCYNCTHAGEPERKLITNELLNYHHIYHNYHHYHHCHPVNGY